METRFYHLTRSGLETTLPSLLQKTLERGWRAVVILSNKAQVEEMNDMLWSFRPDVFLPHGSKEDGHPALQPVWLTDQEENPNKADVIFVCSDYTLDKNNSYALVCRLFDGTNAPSLEYARNCWKMQHAAGDRLTYWQQGENGGWQKKAEANLVD